MRPKNKGLFVASERLRACSWFSPETQRPKIKHNANFDKLLTSLNVLPWLLTALYLDHLLMVNFAILAATFQMLYCSPLFTVSHTWGDDDRNGRETKDCAPGNSHENLCGFWKTTLMCILKVRWLCVFSWDAIYLSAKFWHTSKQQKI